MRELLAQLSWDYPDKEKAMVKLLIKQRVFSWTDSYDIYDAYGLPKYFVKADFFSIGHRLHIYNSETGAEVGVIQEKILTWLGKADIIIGGETKGRISRRWSWFKPKYTIDYLGWDIEGDFLGWDYSILSYNGIVAKISKELFHWGDTYSITAMNDEDELEVLLMALSIDMLNCEK